MYNDNLTTADNIMGSTLASLISVGRRAWIPLQHWKIYALMQTINCIKTIDLAKKVQINSEVDFGVICSPLPTFIMPIIEVISASRTVFSQIDKT